jgi:hypothetical protein
VPVNFSTKCGDSGDFGSYEAVVGGHEAAESCTSAYAVPYEMNDFVYDELGAGHCVYDGVLAYVFLESSDGVRQPVGGHMDVDA